MIPIYEKRVTAYFNYLNDTTFELRDGGSNIEILVRFSELNEEGVKRNTEVEVNLFKMFIDDPYICQN